MCRPSKGFQPPWEAAQCAWTTLGLKVRVANPGACLEVEASGLYSVSAQGTRGLSRPGGRRGRASARVSR